MVTNAVSFAHSTIAIDPKAGTHPDEFRISTKMLTYTLFALNTLAGAYACGYNSQAALAGGLLGATFRMISGDNQLGVEKSEQDQRTDRIALMCLTALAAAYTGATYEAQGFTNFQTFLFIYMGCQGVTNGLYPALRKIVD